MMTDQTLISGAPRVKLKWYQVIDPITKLLFILDMTLLSFTSMFYKEGLIYATTLGCRVLVIILTSGFFMVTTSISENAAYLELSGLSYKTVYVLMSVCYILPEMMRNMRKIQQAQKVRGTNPQKTLIQKLKSVLPVLIPLVIKTLDQSMTRSISLQLRGFDNLNRTVRTSQRVYRLSRTLHIGLTGLAILLIGWKIWTKINGL